MKTSKLILLAICAISVVALSGYKKAPRKATFTYGSYGVCDCEGAGSKEIMVRLTVNEDFTFSYINNADPAKKVDITGKWVWDGDKVFLKEHNSPYPIHDRWAIDKNSSCIKSRLVMNYTRLCKLQPCK
ncbi:MAG: hypothetical protein M0D57_00955 [Sphingobacteriales bacterium JAD_PAG50586_3]|nr:MAG: hypothetical protein M0D57_00955 [Sphingobacteriales bacterium JAD_PAG50586_3]